MGGAHEGAGPRRTIHGVALSFCLLVLAPLASGAAQETPAALCVATMHQQFGGTSALRSECPSQQDCLYQAPIGNASALALLNAMAEKVQACWREAGLSAVEDEREPQGMTRTYTKLGGETCKILLSMQFPTLADGFRAACQPR